MQFRKSSVQRKFDLIDSPCRYSMLGLTGAGILKTQSHMIKNRLYVMKDPSVVSGDSPDCLACLSRHDIVLCVKNGMAMKNIRTGKSNNFKGLNDRVYSLESRGKITVSTELSWVVNIHDNETLELIHIVVPSQANHYEGSLPFKTCRFPKCNSGSTPSQVLLSGKSKTISSLDLQSLKLTDLCSTAFNINSLAVDCNVVAVVGDKTDVLLLDMTSNQE